MMSAICEAVILPVRLSTAGYSGGAPFLSARWQLAHWLSYMRLARVVRFSVLASTNCSSHGISFPFT
jgi:hypothetical protein